MTFNSTSNINPIVINDADSAFPKNLIIFSHLRWDFVYQRPQHLATRLAAICNLYFIEEPLFDASEINYEKIEKDGLTVFVPHLLPGYDHQTTIDSLSYLFKEFIETLDLQHTAFWYYTPMALEFSGIYEPAVVIYDCMDELSAFKFAPPALQSLEKDLFEKADIVFTGGNSLYEAKKNNHHNIHPFPSSIDREHFSAARHVKAQLSNEANDPLPKLGFYGVIDERFDIMLIKEIADARPDWQIALIGPVVKIDPAILPANHNIQYLGSKTYDELPDYMADWDIALIPFLLNESTRFISPTKTPEYLAAGLPVISTAITDVIDPYGVNGLVQIGYHAADFVAMAEQVLNNPDIEIDRLKKVDAFLSLNSWDITFGKMKEEISKVVNQKNFTLSTKEYV